MEGGGLPKRPVVVPLAPVTPLPLPGPDEFGCASDDVTVVLETCRDPDDRRPLEDPAVWKLSVNTLKFYTSDMVFFYFYEFWQTKTGKIT
jgi:hypothetical protein